MLAVLFHAANFYKSGAAGRRDALLKKLEETIRQKSVSDIAVQTTTEEGLVPLPVND